MFSLCMVESEADEVNLHGVTSLGLKQALDFAYTGQVLYSSSNWEREVKAICNKNRSPLKNYKKLLLFTLPSTRSFGLTDLILITAVCVCLYGGVGVAGVLVGSPPFMVVWLIYVSWSICWIREEKHTRCFSKNKYYKPLLCLKNYNWGKILLLWQIQSKCLCKCL